MREILMVIPTYCERQSLPHVLSELHRDFPVADVLVVDDNSPDGTGEWVQEFSEANTWVQVLHRPAKSGLSSAYIQGLQWGIDRGYTIVGQMDADGSHQTSDLERLYGMAVSLEHPAGVIGSRWVKGGSVNDWSWNRKMLSKLGNWYIKAWLGLPVLDATAGFRMYNAAQLQESQALQQITARGYGYQTQMTQNLHAAGYKLREVPISFCERQSGQSKMSADIFWEQLVDVTKSGFRRIWRRRGLSRGN